VLLTLDSPHTYAQWSDCLDELVHGLEDEAGLQRMARGNLSWTGAVAAMFSERLMNEFNRRLTLCSERLTRDMGFIRDEGAVVRAILNARKSLHFLYRLAQIPAFPETLRTHLTDELHKFAARSQNSLEDTAKADRSGRLTVLLRHNSLLRYDVLTIPIENALIKTETYPSPSSAVSPAATNLGMRRRNILT
jgi:hypothetical protein